MILRKQSVCLPDDGNVKETLNRYGVSWLIDRVCINVIRHEVPIFHSHPWNFVSIILWGKYKEYRVIDGKIVDKVHGIGAILHRRYDEFHRITPYTNRVVTLFFRSGAKTKSSMYMIDGEVMSDTKYWIGKGYDKELVKDSYNKMHGITKDNKA